MALYDLEIQFYVADGEADVVIARLANHYRCPVLSLDSDFFVFRLVGGFIHFKYFDWESYPATAVFYHRDWFAGQLCFRDTSLICMIPALVGNDFMEPCHPYFLKLMVCSVKSPRVRKVCCHLSKFSSVKSFIEESFGGKTLEPKCLKAQQWYEGSQDLSCEELVLSTDLRHHNGSEFPKWLVRLFHLGHIPSSAMGAAVSCKAIFRVVADNFKKDSSVLAAKPIRERMYALLEVQTVVEVVRSGLTLAKLKANTKEREYRAVTATSVSFLSHQERQSLFYEILECSKQNINLKLSGSYQDWRFVAATVRFWARTTCPPTYLVRSLLLCFTLCSCLPDESFRRLKVPLWFRQSQEWLDTLHWFCQWQAIYHAAWTLNALLMEPMWVFSPAFLYDGELAMYLASSGDTSQLMGEVDMDLFNCLEEIVLSAEQVTPSEQKKHQTKDTSSQHSIDDQQGAVGTQIRRTPSQQVEGRAMPNEPAGEHEGSTETPSTAEAQVLSQECVKAKPKRKRSRRKKARTSTGRVEVVTFNGASTSTTDKHLDNPSTIIPSSQTSAKLPVKVKPLGATPMASTTVQASELGFGQPPLRTAGPKSDRMCDTSKSPGQQPSPALNGLSANAKRRRYRRRPNMNKQKSTTE